VKPLPSSRFFFTLSLGSAGVFLASPPGIFNFPSGPAQELSKIGVIKIKTRIFSDFVIIAY
jgi:hypothetical protein